MEEIKEEKEEQVLSSIDEAKQLLKSMQAEREAMTGLVNRQEALRAEQILSGKSEGGTVPAVKPEEAPEDYAKKVMANDTEE